MCVSLFVVLHLYFVIKKLCLKRFNHLFTKVSMGFHIESNFMSGDFEITGLCGVGPGCPGQLLTSGAETLSSRYKMSCVNLPYLIYCL